MRTDSEIIHILNLAGKLDEEKAIKMKCNKQHTCCPPISLDLYLSYTIKICEAYPDLCELNKTKKYQEGKAITWQH